MTDKDAPLKWGERKELPTRRHVTTQKVKIGGQSIFVSVGRYKDGSFGEIFIDMHKQGTAFRAILNAFSMVASIAVQYGVPPKVIVDALKNIEFEPSGNVQGHDVIKHATSVIDYIAKEIMISSKEDDD